MQTTSQLYKDIVAGDHWFEVSLAAGEIGVLLTDTGEDLLFGGYKILLSSSTADGGYRENVLTEMRTVRKLFPSDKPTIGGAVASELTVTLLRPSGEIPRMARIVPYVRATDGVRKSEWIKKGVFFIDTRSYDVTTEGIETVTIHAYDQMLMTEQDYVPTIQFPAYDIGVVSDICNIIGCGIDQSVRDALWRSYRITLPVGYSCREMLSYIAVMNAGNFIFNDNGDLSFVRLGDIERETNYLISNSGDVLVWDDTNGSGELVRLIV